MSSVGQAVGGLVGGAVGFFTGGLTGALYGAQIGMGVGGLIDPPKGPTINGPRLNDLTVQTSTYGAPLPRIYGSVATMGNIFWLENNKLKEVAKKEEQGGKGGGGGSTVKTYSYFATFAVGLADTSKTGPIAGVRRIWIGGNLIYDAGSNEIESIIASNEAAKGFRVYTGSEDQLPDPRMEADVGVDNCPAYRGVAYIVFYDLPLKDYGNSLIAAQVKVEVMANADISFCPSRTQLPVMFPSNGALQLSLAYESGTLIVGNGDTTPPRAERWTLDGDFIQVIKEFPQSVSANGFNYTFSMLSKTNPLSALYRRSFLGPIYICVRDGVVCEQEFEIGPIGHQPDMVDLNDASYVVARQGLIKIRDGLVEKTYSFGLSPGGTNFSIGASETRIYVYVPTPDSSNRELFEFDEDLSVTGRWMIGEAFGSNSTIMPWPISHRVLWGYFGPDASNITTLNDDGTFDYSCGQSGAWFNNAVNIKPHGINDVWFSRSSANSSNWWVRNNLVQNFSAELSDIIESECLQSGLLQESDIDVTDIDQEVRGYRVAQTGAIRGALEPLRGAWPFDVIQSGYQIKFVRRGKTSVATIDTQELDARPYDTAPGVQITLSHEMDTQLPRKVAIRYLDVNREYDTSEQNAERLNTDAVNIREMELPIVLTANESAGMAEVLLYLYWLERRDVSFRLPPQYRYLEPTDVITITGEWGQYELRLTRINLESDGRLACSAKFNAAEIYTPTAEGAEGDAPGQTVGLDGPSLYIMLDVPLLADNFNSPGWPAAMSGYLSGWPGGIIYRSNDGGATWVDLQGFTSPVTIGYGRDSIGAGRFDIVDASSVLTVDMVSGDISSISEESQFSGGNLLAYGAPGRWEICAPRTAELQVDGSIKLSDFLRGRFGTEWAASLHQAGDAIVLMTDPDLAWIPRDAASIGLPREYRGITSGRAIDTDTSRTETYEAVNLTPLSPVYLNGSRHPSTRDWTLTWIRRGRVSPGWRNSVDVPIGEATESYEVDIYSDGTYTTVVRTLSSSSQSVSYTSAQQVTDFGSNQATLYVKVYQLSETVGRGYALTDSITRG